MRTYSGSPWQGLSPEIREALAPMDRYLRDLSPAFGRLANGRVPEGSGLAVGSPRIGVSEENTSLVDYLYLPGRSAGQTVNGAVTFTGSVTLSSAVTLSGAATLTDSLFSLLDNLDPTKIAQFQCSVIGPGTTRTYTLPDASGTLALTSTVDTARTWATMQTFNDTTIMVVDEADASKTLSFSLGGAAAASDLTLTWAGTGVTTVALPATAGTIALTSGIDAARSWATLQTFNDTTFKVVDDGDATKTLSFSLGGATAGADCIIAWVGTLDRTITLPNATTTLFGLTDIATLTNKTMAASCALRVDSSFSGCGFEDTNTTSKKLKPILSGAVGTNTLTLTNTAARDYRLRDYSADVVLVGNTTAAAGTLGKSDLTAQAGSIGATTMLTSSANSSGRFRVTFYIVNTVVGNAADTVKVGVAWNDGAAQAAEVLLTNAANAPVAPAILHSLTTVGNASYGSIEVYAAASTAITFTTTVALIGTPQYTCRARIEALG